MSNDKKKTILSEMAKGKPPLSFSNFEDYLRFVFEGKKGVTSGEWSIIYPDKSVKTVIKSEVRLSPQEMSLLLPLRVLWLILYPIAVVLGSVLGVCLAVATLGLIYYYGFALPLMTIMDILSKQN